MYYQIKDFLTECSRETCLQEAGKVPFAAVLTPEEWSEHREDFDMGIDLDREQVGIYNTKAEENYDSITGTFCIPDREDVAGPDFKFSFALDEKGIVFIDSSGYAQKLINGILQTRKWRYACLERFIYDFLEQIILEDRTLLETLETELREIEDGILKEEETNMTFRINEIRGDLLDLRTHYEQLIDLGQMFEENENNFFKERHLRYFRLFNDRAERRHGMIVSLQDYTVQIRDLYQAQLGIRQNRIMTILTIVTTIFMPLTLIVGWYGMNFRYMPELDSPYAYPIVIAVCLLISIGSLMYFKYKKWL